MKKKVVKLFAGLTVTAMLAAACSGGGSAPKATEGSKTPVANDKPPVIAPAELSILYPFNDFETFKTGFEQKYPGLTLKHVPKLEPEMVATGNVPDVLWLINGLLGMQSTLLNNNLQFDMGDLVKTHKFDLSRIQPELLENAKAYNNGKLNALPVSRLVYQLYYNKDIFDRFGVPYPDANKAMTWEQVVELAKKLTRTDGGVQYRGFDLERPPAFMLDTLGIVHVDPVTHKTRYSEDPGFKTFYAMIKAFADIPGIFTDDPAKQINNGIDDFLKDRNVAMMAVNHYHTQLIQAEKESGLKWDIAPMPVWSHLPGIEPLPFTNHISISPISKHKDAAFKVIEYVLSDEYQIDMIKRAANGTVLANKDIMLQFGKDLPELASKNVKASFIHKPAKAPSPVSEYERLRQIPLFVAEYIKDKPDINTLLRKQDEAHAKRIAEDKAKTGKQ